MDIARARKHMVDSQVRPNDVTDVRLQNAMASLPRERFVPANRRGLAYVEKDVPLFEGRWLPKARDFSKLIHGAKIQSSDLVLDIGCGYGYSCAVLSHLAGMVVGLEDNDEAVAKATELCTDLSIDNVAFVEADLSDGCEKQGPYDVITISGGVAGNLDKVKSQLKPEGGRLVAIIVENGVGKATLITRHGDTFGQRALFEAHPAGIMPAFAPAAGFVF